MRYSGQISWSGSTGRGWDAYERAHIARAAPAHQELRLTTGESHGDPELLNPEQLVLLAASSCQMLWFLHLAAKARIDVVAYEDECEAEMPADRLTQIVLRPRIVVRGEGPRERIERLCRLAHEQCNVAKSLATPVRVEPTIER